LRHHRAVGLAGDGDVGDPAAAVGDPLPGGGHQDVAEPAGGDVGDVAGGRDGGPAGGVARQGEGRVGQREDVAAVHDAVAVDHGVADRHAGAGVPERLPAGGVVARVDAQVDPQVEDLDAERGGGTVVGPHATDVGEVRLVPHVAASPVPRAA